MQLPNRAGVVYTQMGVHRTISMRRHKQVLDGAIYPVFLDLLDEIMGIPLNNGQSDIPITVVGVGGFTSKGASNDGNVGSGDFVPKRESLTGVGNEKSLLKLA